MRIEYKVPEMLEGRRKWEMVMPGAPTEVVWENRKLAKYWLSYMYSTCKNESCLGYCTNSFFDCDYISYFPLFEGLGALRLFYLQNPHVNSGGKGCSIPRKRVIETLEGMAQGTHHQTTITSFFIPRSDIYFL